MKYLSVAKIAIATTTFACTALLSVGWSGQGDVSLSVESAQARVGRPLTPVSVAGVARRQNRRAAYGYGYGAGVVGAGLVGAGVAAAAVGTAAAAATYPGYYGDGYYGGYGGYYAESPWGDYECRNPYGYPCNPYSARWGTGATAAYAAQPYVGAGYYGRPLARAAYYGALRY